MTDPVIIGNATLYLGDCLDILPTLGPVDAVVTDPPYGLNFPYASYDDTRSNLIALIAASIGPLREKAARLIITPGQTQVWLYPPANWICAVSWDTTGSFGHCGYTQWMPVLVYGDDVQGFGRNASGAIKSDVLKFSGGAGVGFQREPNNDHPCPKPVNVMTSIIRRFTDAGQTILDPFMGSGTTGVACAKLGRKFIGSRIEEAQRQSDLFIPMTQAEKAKDSHANYDLALEELRKR